ncbi:hypothetical protein TELCIR_01334 [Teladorsagia circumcincta]|uniref:Uncharacterized protein n=1 Tax=Teladorsagia circumcincta TaxID=45464 RepID=A0A2G9V3P7_TELCI|nr:hypothetical protein TELCIR_01334 [Teladorsagia circumcincta]
MTYARHEWKHQKLRSMSYLVEHPPEGWGRPQTPRRIGAGATETRWLDHAISGHSAKNSICRAMRWVWEWMPIRHEKVLQPIARVRPKPARRTFSLALRYGRLWSLSASFPRLLVAVVVCFVLYGF